MHQRLISLSFKSGGLTCSAPGQRLLPEIIDMNRNPADDIPRFPLCVASIDVGSNAIRFLAAEFKNLTSFSPVFADRYPLRLGHDAFFSGRLTQNSIEGAVTGLMGFADHIERLGISRYRAVATSAVRESENGDTLLARAREQTGIEIDSISSREEARLVLLSVKSRVRLGGKMWILADLGGGSVEVSLAADTGILWSESYGMGAVRLLEELAGSGMEPGKFRMLLSEYVKKLHIPAAVLKKKPAGFIATGGNIETIASLVDRRGEGTTSRVTTKELGKLIKKLTGLSFAERVRELHLKEDRADVILPASLVYERLAVLAGAKQIIVPHAYLREGLVLDLVSPG